MPSRDIHKNCQKWAQQYGPIFSLILGTQTQIVLSSDEVVREPVDTRSAVYSSRPGTFIAQDVLSEGNRLLMMPYGPTWRMLRKTVHTLLVIHRAKVYVPYQNMENKQMLFELLTQLDRFLESVRRDATSLTTSMTFGWRTTDLDDPRMIQLFDGVEKFTQIIQDVSSMMLDVFPVLRYLADSLLPPKRKA